LFRDAVKALTRRDEDEPQPQARRRRGETGKGFVSAWRVVLHRTEIQPEAVRAGVIDTGKTFGDAAKAVMRRVAQIPTEAYTASTAYLLDTLDWLNLWDANSSADNSGDLDLDYETQQNHHSPHL
jgi:hypothetical protein